MNVILNIPPPATKQQMSSLLVGVVRFYQKVTSRYVLLLTCAPLTDLLRGRISGSMVSSWTASCTDVFNALKAYLANRPVLKASVYLIPCKLYHDVSDSGDKARL